MNHIQTEEQVLPEAALANFLLEILVRSGNETDIDGNRTPTADPFNFPFLEDAKQFGLGSEAEVTDLVEKQGSTVCRLNPASAPLDARRHALLDAEQFTLDQSFR